MSMLLRREWRDALKPGALALLLPLLAGAGAVWILPPAAGAHAIALLAGTLALPGTARRLWREQRTGCLQRLALSPLPAPAVLGARLLARASVVAAQVLPLVLAAAWRRHLLAPAGAAAPGGLPGATSAMAGPASAGAAPWAAAALAALLGAVLAGVAVGAIVGLRVRRWRQMHGTAALLLAAAWLLALPAPEGGLLHADPLANASLALGALLGGPAPVSPAAAAAAPLAVGAGIFALIVALARKLLQV